LNHHTSKPDRGWLGLSQHITGRRPKHRRSVRESLELACSDLPLLCCDDDQLCPACCAATSPELAALAS